MISLSTLWPPIVLSAVLVFIVSSVIHMVLTFWHKDDFHKVPDEKRFMDAVRPLALPPGDYTVPRPSSMKEMGSPEFVEKFKAGPVMIFTVIPSGPVTMTKSLVNWFLFSLVVSLFAGYVGASALPAGSHYGHVFQVVGTTAFIGYAFALWPSAIWYGRSWTTTLKGTIDGLVYGLLTGGTFGWLWPQ